MPLLHLQNLSFQYPPIRKGLATTLCLNQVSFTLDHGQTIGLIGQNGAGKSTLFKILSGAIDVKEIDLKNTENIPYQITLNGEDIRALSLPQRIQKGMCYAPQKGGLFEDLTVRDHFKIAMYQKYKKTHVGLFAGIKWFFLERLDRSLEAQLWSSIKDAEFDELSHLKVSALSGGEKKRLLLSTYLLLSPICLLLDEPFASLDQFQINKLIKVLKSLKNRGVAILICDHQVEHLYDFCDHIYELSQGKLKNHQIIENR
jgi:ABC-type multidrug transport system ATPase subunit